MNLPSEQINNTTNNIYDTLIHYPLTSYVYTLWCIILLTQRQNMTISSVYIYNICKYKLQIINQNFIAINFKYHTQNVCTEISYSSDILADFWM